MPLALDIAALTVLLLLVHEGFRRAGEWMAWGWFLALPLALTPHWIAVNDFDLFAWAKLYTILFCACWLTALRFTGLGRRWWAPATVTGLFALNILEAVVVDLVAARPANLVNAAGGLLLVATLPRTPRAVRIDANRHFRDLHYSGLSRGWIGAFVLWNWTFLLLNYPLIAGHHLAVLGAAFVVGLIDSRRWLQARMYTLAADLLALATFGPVLLPRTDTSHWSTPHLALGAALATLATVLFAVVFHRQLGEFWKFRAD